MSLIGSLVGCVGDDQLGEQTQGVVSDNRISLNRISLNRISLNRISLNRISLNRISLNNLQANLASIGDLLDTADGREVFSFVVSCALSEGITLTVNHPTLGQLFFFGELGLAPRWETRPMNRSDQRWVSACLLSRVNNNDVTVQVSLRGPDDELAASAEERAAWSLQEGAFYGDVFQPDDKPLRMYACRGRDQAAGNETGDMDARDCTEPDAMNPGFTQCGMTYAGDCADFEEPKNKYACKREVDGYYVKCTPTASFGRKHRSNDHDDDDDDDDDDHDNDRHGDRGHHNKFREVITAFVQP